MSEHSKRLDEIRHQVRTSYLEKEERVVSQLAAGLTLTDVSREKISQQAVKLVQAVRDSSDPNLMESFLTEYGLSTKEGVALMCLAEAMLRVPDSYSVDALIADKVSPANWGKHLGQSASSMVNASTWGLMLTGKILDDEEDGLAQSLRSLVRRVGEPVIRTAVGQAMKELGENFVLARSIEEASKRAEKLENQGYCYSYDMLGEAARTDRDAKHYHIAYSDAIAALAPACKSDVIRENPGISVKLSALHPRYEFGQKETVMAEVVGRARSLALLAKSANMGFNIDAEEADRLDLSLDVIEAILSDPALKGWDGFGVVVQAYSKRASHVLDWLYELSNQLDRRIMVRLVKGAYWDTEIKRAQVLGLKSFPVFTRKENTDLSYLACAEKLLQMTDRIYPQFATHNAHTVSAILGMTEDKSQFEFQRLHGMGESLHDLVLKEHGSLCRIYAPVGSHQDLLAYLVRRLLENGANSSFVNQLVDEDISPEEIAVDPITEALSHGSDSRNSIIPLPKDIFTGRVNSRGLDITDHLAIAELERRSEPFKNKLWHWGENGAQITNPARQNDLVGTVKMASAAEVNAAVSMGVEAFARWNAVPPAERADKFEIVADLYEAHSPELMTLLCREAGKTLLDAVGELREAVDFLRYYASEARAKATTGPVSGRGLFACISPWNFPLAIFTGQIVAALVTGNTVIAKPAETTVLTASKAVQLFHEAGVPTSVLQLLPGLGSEVGAALTADPRVSGICFTGSTETAQIINGAQAAHAEPEAVLIAETGGINAMIVDSTALPEQAVRDILASAFQSAGQRCSALRILYVQDDVADRTLKMLFGAMDALRIGDPGDLSTDVGPVIDGSARRSIIEYLESNETKVLKQLSLPEVCDAGYFVPPTVLKVEGIADLQREVFGPVLHVAIFEPEKLDQVIDEINGAGYGLTLGLHTRIDQRVEQLVEKAEVSNIYVNRNQIGAVVGSQPFGGEGLSGTGPKAGGPLYLERFMAIDTDSNSITVDNLEGEIAGSELSKAWKGLDNRSWSKIGEQERSEALLKSGLEPVFPSGLSARNLPGPTGESNKLEFHPRGRILCLGEPGSDQSGSTALAQAKIGLVTGNAVLVAAGGVKDLVDERRTKKLPVTLLNGTVPVNALSQLEDLAAVVVSGNSARLSLIRQELAKRDGPLVPMITDWRNASRLTLERAVCVDTTAAGGNAVLLAAVS